MKGWLGVDVGSVSIKLALINEKKEVIKDVYLKNSGIAETIKKGLKEMNNGCKIEGVGCTGSGRVFAGLILGGDTIKTEILAHTIATLNYYPDVKTVLDIGGEDCKIMSIENGILTSFIMNSICSAGTGSVIETIASRLGISIEDVGELALQSKKRLDFPGKCGVFCQSAVVSRLNSGADKRDIMMGVVRALVHNYLNLAKGIRLEPPYVFQGATALNKAVVRALEEELGSKVFVHEKCSVMGAIGIALLTQEENKETKFRGFRFKDLNVDSVNIKCNHCTNLCELTQLFEGKKLLGCVGSRCGKWDSKKWTKKV